MLTALFLSAGFAQPPSAGQELFEREWTVEQGLGPYYNASSCVECHHQGGAGGGGELTSNVLTLPRSGVVHNYSTERDWPDRRERLLNPEFEFQEGMCGTAMMHMMAASTPTVRQTPALFGSGLLDQVTQSQMEQVAKAGTARFPEVTGRIPTDFGGTVTRFGWKAQTENLESFVDAACDNELGLDQEEMPPTERAKLVSFIASLPAPAPSEHEGRSTFEEVGCNACHATNIGLARGAYTDLLLHDMGHGLADAGFGYGGVDHVNAATPTEWRTPPLWGVATSAPYLHDGRAKTLQEAIEAHDGEAKPVMVAYNALSAADREELLGFLKSLK